MGFFVKEKCILQKNSVMLVCGRRGSLFGKGIVTDSKLDIEPFDFAGNAFSDKVAMAFSETLKENRQLSELDLSYNNFGETGGLYLGAGLVSSFHSLFYITVNKCWIFCRCS